MPDRSQQWCVLLALALVPCTYTAPASAHAPLPRAVAVSSDGASVALALPGFGLLMRSGADASFSYACDALLGVPAADQPPALQYFADGTLLLGSPGGLRRIAADGCRLEDRHPILDTAPVSAVAIHPTTQIAYAIAAGAGDGVWRSSDRGVHWERRGSLQGAHRVTGLAIDPGDATKLFVSTAGVDETATLLVSSDAGAAFTAYPQERALRLLAVQAAPARLWVVARAADNKGNRGFEILRAQDVQSAWSQVLRVNYFGGLTISPSGRIWVGDEGGGIYASIESGDSFGALDSRSRVACLASTSETVWACTPDIATAPALQFLDDTAATLQPAVAFADVTRLVSCGAEVESLCEAAWVEWQRDVLMRDLTAADAGPAPPSSVEPDAVDAGAPRPLVPAPRASCAVAEAARGVRTIGGAWLLVAVGLGWRVRVRDVRAGRTLPS